MAEQGVRIPTVRPDIGPIETCARCLGPVDMSDWHLTFSEAKLEELPSGLDTHEFDYVAVVCKKCAPKSVMEDEATAEPVQELLVL